MTKAFSPLILTQGQRYYVEGYVLSLRLSEGMVKARVKDKNTYLYDVYFDLKNWPEKSARCTCTKADCVHAAACFYYLLAQSSLDHSGVKPTAPLRKTAVIQPEKLIISEWHESIQESDTDLFSYQLGVVVNGITVNLVPFVAEWIARGGIHAWEQLPDDQDVALPLFFQNAYQHITVPLKKIKPLLHLLLQYGLRLIQQDTVMFNRYHLISFYQASSLSVPQWRCSAKLLKKIEKVVHFKPSDSAFVPAGLQASLRDYQKEGIEWLTVLRTSRFGGILADDMGLGKTIQTLGYLLWIKEKKLARSPSLIVVPTSLVMNWYEEAQKFTPNLNVQIYHGTQRYALTLTGVDVILTTYGVVQRDLERLQTYAFDSLFLDEAQAIKNADAKITQAVRQIRASHRLCLTGTPLENHLGELWSLFHFLMPGFLGNERQFKTYFQIPIEKQRDIEKKTLLARRIKPFMLRRCKAEVAKELPEKTEIIQFVELTGRQRDMYEVIRLTMEKKVRLAIAKSGLGQSKIILLDALLKLRQICCDPRLLKTPGTALVPKESAKLEALLDLLQILIAEGRRILIFSQFTSMLSLIEKTLQAHNICFLKLTGKTQKRHLVVDEFQKGEVPVFLISLKAGGSGLNLTRADVVIHYDPWWNPQVEDQATARSYRINQTNPIFVYKLVAAGTVEEAILRMQNKKRALFKSILESSESGFDLSEMDLQALFQSLDSA